ncbi:thioesterase family protein [Waddlia chondrophila WSU 86-1044]|uniref:Thioesterase family protein n=2 Tax=Waddlia chondrophila TaxID=71667 RepID=D6YTW1_WADCW|nr:hotdog fold thioesterase [Waddlia chondrophila]ADI37572.1 thioesterase family protein [Waddlia chondrophila WSU 86-1044]
MMSIWKSPITIESISAIREKTMTEHVGIEFTEVGENFLKGKMPVDDRTKQPFGIMHGGASCVLAETLGSVAACHCVEIDKQVCVGLSLNINHIRMARSGWVYGIARPVHIGGKTQVWDIAIENEEGDLVSSTRLTLAVLDRR